MPNARDALLSSTVSFAHLHGIARPVAGRSRAEEMPADDKDESDNRKDDDRDEGDADREDQDGKKGRKAKRGRAQGDDESDDDYAKRMEEEGEESEDEDGNEDKGDYEDGDNDREEKDGKQRGALFRRGVSAERARWASVLGSKFFAGNPALGARLLSTTSLSARTIIGCLRDSPAVGASRPDRAARNPNVGPSGGRSPGAGPNAIQDRWSAAFKRAGVTR